jgi:hypothetical protein
MKGIFMKVRLQKVKGDDLRSSSTAGTTGVTTR